jgi:hypothetical protein
MEKKFAKVGKLLSKEQAKKIIGGLEDSFDNCSNLCYSEADCPNGYSCNSVVCLYDITKFETLCFRS